MIELGEQKMDPQLTKRSDQARRHGSLVEWVGASRVILGLKHNTIDFKTRKKKSKSKPKMKSKPKAIFSKKKKKKKPKTQKLKSKPKTPDL